MTSYRTLEMRTDIGALARNVQWLLRRALMPLAAILVVGTGYLAVAGHRGALAFGFISLGAWIALAIWNRGGIGLPLLPVLVVQHLVTFGLPIITGHHIIDQYSDRDLTGAGVEVFLFCLSLALGWWIAMQGIASSPPISHVLKGFRQGGLAQLKRLGLTLMIASSAFQLAQSLSLLDAFYGALPAGSYPLVVSIVGAASTCGFFLVALFVGSGAITTAGRVIFWVLLTLNCALSASNFLLSAPATVIASVGLGLFWSTGRTPWRFLTVVILLLAFLNLGKFTMRERYWQTDDDDVPKITLAEMPRCYVEWAEASAAMLGIGQRPEALGRPGAEGGRQSLLERINNLQNLLFVIKAVDADAVTPLHGATYTLIPSLLVPRIVWPEKPRTHEGQVMLNVHFGRQDLNSTYSTYVAWGLLAEAYGNFGPIVGALLLGLFLGGFCAWIEKLTARKLLMSLEGFLGFTLLLSIINSYEMVASVLVTTVFQALIPIVVASLPFVERARGATLPEN